MIPVGAGIRLYRGLKRRHALEEQLSELQQLCSTPAITHYRGIKRFEVAGLLADAKLGLLLESGTEAQQARSEIDVTLQILKGEFDMVLEESSRTPATKAEVFALGLALRELALSLDDTVTEFRATSEDSLSAIKQRAEQLTQTQLQAMEVFEARSQEHLDHALTSAETRLQTSLSRIDAVVAETPASFRSELDAVRTNVTVGFMLLKWSCGGLFVAVCLLAVCVVALFVAR